MQYLLYFSAGLLLLTACGPGAGTGERGLTWIEISTNDSWLLTVDADGGGYLAYGPFSGQRVQFPAATFDFKDLRRDIRSCPQEYPGRHALVSRIFSARQHEIEQYYCLDTLIGREWLGAAYRALPVESAAGDKYRLLCRRWQADPPLAME